MITFPPVSMLDWLIFLLVSGGSLIALITLLKFIWRPALKPPYLQKSLFSTQQKQALQLLDEAIGSQLRVFASVSLAELVNLNPKLSKSQRELASQQLYGETVDFVLCSPKDLTARCVVFLAQSGLSKKEQRKQRQLWQALRAAGLPVIELSVYEWPSMTQLRTDILNACKNASPSHVTHSAKAGSARVEPVISALDHDFEQEDEPSVKLPENP